MGQYMTIPDTTRKDKPRQDNPIHGNTRQDKPVLDNPKIRHDKTI